MTQRSRASRREAARARQQAAGPRRWLLPAIAVAVVVLAAGAALVLSQGQDGGSSDRPSAGASAPVDGAAPTIEGAALPALLNPTNDSAVGMTIPEVTAPGGTIALDGRPKVLLFLAHWCPHCQNEVPLVQDWLDSGGLPEGVDLIAVSTSIDPSRPNYPPEDWLAEEGWTPPTIVDPTGAVADAYGLAAFPFWVFVGEDGTVRARTTGELSINDLESLIAGLTQ
jgi:cytochrome c biogenesis protein CcmG, thiol:disulfide interchange protein DsbE